MRILSIFLLFIIQLFTYPHILTAQSTGSVGIKITGTPNTALDVNGSIAFREGTALALNNGVNSDVVLSDYSLFRITGPTATFSITGFASGQNGRVLTLINATAYTLTFTHQTTSLSINQINTGGSSLNLAANGVATFIYNSALTQWVVSGGIGFFSAWSLSGNGITDMWNNKLGTTTNYALNIISNNTNRLFVMPEGGITFGRTDEGYSTPTNFPTYGINATDASIIYPTESGGVSDLRTYITDDPTDKTSVWGATTPSTDLSTYGERFSVRGDGQTYIYGNTAFGSYSSNPNDGSLLWSGAFDNSISLQKNYASLTAGTLYRGISSIMGLSNTSNSANTIHGITSDMQINALSAANFTSLIRGVGSDFRHNGSGIVNEVEGLNAHVGNYGLGTITNAYGLQAHVFRSTGTITNAYGGAFLAWGGSATNYGLYSNPANSATNNYMYYGTMTGGINTDWGIYLTGEDKNYFSNLVGIGTTSPSAALHVSSNNAGLYNDILLSGYNAGDIPVFNIRRARGTEVLPVNLVNGDGLGGNHYYGYINGGWSYLSGVQSNYKGNGTTIFSSLDFLTSNSVRMTLDENGSLAIGTGTATVGFKLSVNGSADKAGGGAWAVFSDSRIKRNVRPFTEGLAILEKIKPVWFQYNKKSDYADTTKTYVGIIAQDIEQIAPYMIEKTKTANFDDQRVYDSNALNYILVNSVKELSEENKKLKAQNDALKTELDKHTRDIEIIKSMLEKRQN